MIIPQIIYAKDGIEISVLFKRGVNCAVEKCIMTFKNKYCINHGYEYLHEGNLIF